jgi:hypothetical protein
MLLWVTLPGGRIQKNCWNITNDHDTRLGGFWFKLILGFLPTLERQRAWYPQVYNRPELFLCAKCKQTTETPEHMFECVDRTEIEACFRDRYRSLQPRETEPIDISTLRPWDWLGLLQGRVHPSWKSMILALQQGMQRTASTAAVIQQLLRASLETWYHAIWQPRCNSLHALLERRDHALPAWVNTSLQQPEPVPRPKCAYVYRLGLPWLKGSVSVSEACLYFRAVCALEHVLWVSVLLALCAQE